MEKNNRNSGGKSSVAGVSESKETAAFFPRNAFVTDVLCATLASLDASNLKCIHKKAMAGSDMRGSPNRLLISCKKKMTHSHGEKIPFTGMFTDKDWSLVNRRELEKMMTQQREKHGSNSKSKKGGAREDKGKKRKKGGDGNKESNMGENDEQEEKKNTEPGLSVEAYDRNDRDEGIGAREAAAADCAGDVPTIEVGMAGGEPGGIAAPRSSQELRLTPLEMLIALWLVSLKYIHGEKTPCC
uniref:Uncharacterized protein n=1 Tax=Setaria italica TaxID=4555 RepID=K3ZFA5_SETIT